MGKKSIYFVGLAFVSLLLNPSTVHADWPMAGANPARTGWVSETLPDVISTQWVKPIYPYVSQKVQVIGAENKVYVSTAAGLYAFNAADGQDAWKYPTALPLGHSPTYSNGYLYVGGMDKKIHKIRASDGQGIWTFTADGGFTSSPIVANGKVYATNRDGALYAINDLSTPTLAWKFQTGNQIDQSPAFADNTLYFASNDGYGYAVNATTGAMLWQSDADPTTSVKDKFPSQGFHSWWPVIYGDDVIFTKTGFLVANGAEACWLFGTTPEDPNGCWPTGTGPNPNMFIGKVGYETQPGYWPVGEKIVDLSENPNGTNRTLINYFESTSLNTRIQYGQHRRNAFFVNRNTGIERRFDLDSDGIPDTAPIAWTGDGGNRTPPVVSGYNNVLYFNSVVRARGSSFNGVSIMGWRVGTPFVSVTMDGYRSSDEPMGVSAAGDKIYYNHCCDREIRAVNISRPNTDNAGEPAREWSYINGGGLSFFAWPLAMNGVPNTQNNYYYKEAVKYFWNPQPQLDPPCCPAVFWNENDKVGPSIYNGRQYVIMGNSLVALGTGGAGTSAPLLSTSPNVSPPTFSPQVTETELRAKLETEVSEIIAAGHLKPSFLFSGGVNFNNNSRIIDDNFLHYWHNPAETQQILLRALPFITNTTQNQNLQNRLKTYLQSEFASYNPSTYSHTGFVEGTQRDPWLYPPAETILRLFDVPTLGKSANSNFNGVWGFPPNNVYAIWKYAQAGLGNASTLFTQWGTRLRTPITANNSILTDTYLADHPLVTNAYIAGYKGYVELAKMAGQPYSTFEAEYNRLLALRKNLLTTFPNSQNSAASSYRDYYPTMITYYNFAYMTPELADYLKVNARSSDPNKDILSILQKYQTIAPYWMQAHNPETQGESTIQPYQQTHSLFQALAQVKDANRSELLKYLDTPIVPVGDLYYIDNLVAVLEADGSTTNPSPTPTPLLGDLDFDGDVDINDHTLAVNLFGNPYTVYDYNNVVTNFGR